MFKDDKISTDFLNTQEALWKSTEKLSDFVGRAADFDAIFYVGGHGPMFDLATDQNSLQIIREFYEARRVVSAVCHGPAVFINAKLSDGKHLLDGASVTGFSNTEEESVGLLSAMPFSLEDELNKASGGKFVKADEPWGEKVVVTNGGRLITGQNPASASGVGKAIYAALSGNSA